MLSLPLSHESRPLRTRRPALDSEVHFSIWWGPYEGYHVRNHPSHALLFDPHTLLVSRSFGESAGGESVALQMVTNGGNPEGLFRAAWMDSGSLPPSENSSALQPTFDSFAADVGCASAKNVLACLRDTPLEAFIGAMNKTESFLSFKVATSACHATRS